MYSRRTFLKKIINTIKYTAAGAICLPLLLKSSPASAKKSSYDLIALKGGTDAADLFRRGIAQMGGMGKFVRKGQTVLIKPNIGWDRSPEAGANTNNNLIREIAEHCRKAGASRTYVLDHTCDYWKSCYKNSGIEESAKAGGAKMVPANSRSQYRKVSIPGAKLLKETFVHRLFLEADVIINVPVLKDHSSTGLTSAMKNLMGVVWDRYEWHSMGLHQCIADFASFRKPDLVVIDGFRVMIKNGPRGYSQSDIVEYKYLFLSRDQVTADAAAAMVLAETSPEIKSPYDIEYIRLADKAGTGKADLKKMKIKRIAV